jgi:pyruvate dehydrogenase E2 component (dihydrolipoamide acetyltransferase)
VEGKLVEPTRMRAAIAKRMHDSKTNAPHFYVQTDVEVDALLVELEEINASPPAVHVTMTAALAWGCAQALKTHPRFNSVWTPDGLQEVATINLGLAVALKDGLVAPAILGVGELTMIEFAQAIEDLRVRTHAQRLRPSELTDGTFTLSNLGAFPVTAFTAIITPPQIATLATARARERCVMRGGEPLATRVLTVTLSADHRAVDGADAASWLQTFKQNLELNLPRSAAPPGGPNEEVVQR